MLPIASPSMYNKKRNNPFKVVQQPSKKRYKPDLNAFNDADVKDELTNIKYDRVIQITNEYYIDMKTNTLSTLHRDANKKRISSNQSNAFSVTHSQYTTHNSNTTNNAFAEDIISVNSNNNVQNDNTNNSPINQSNCTPA
eukprot:48744_1